MNDINQLKHFDALDYEGEYFTNELIWIFESLLSYCLFNS